jgi:non-ribosomal peptide synthase protein (TIGR01720 family)
VLGIAQVGLHENFFALGGDSILSIQIVARAGQRGLRLTPRQLFERPTIAGLAALLETQEREHPMLQAEQALVQGAVPLTAIQRWYFAQPRRCPEHYNQSHLLRWRGGLNLAWLEEVLQGLLRHHDALRMRFEPTETGWRQENLGVSGLPASILVQVDLSALAPQQRRGALEAAAQQAQRSLDLQRGPLLRALAFELGEGEPVRVLLVIHHLVVDGVSWRILLEDVQEGYRQRERGEPLRWPAKTTSFQQWARGIEAYARSPQVRQEGAYWHGLGEAAVGKVAPVLGTGAEAQSETRGVQVRLSARQTQALLQEVPPVYQTQINDVLLTALGRSLALCWGGRRWRIDLEGHGREEVVAGADLSRTVGWFTSIYPVVVEVEGEEEIGASVKRVKEQLRGVPRQGIGYGIVRYLGEEEEGEGLRRQEEAEIRFNYLGQVDGTYAGMAGVWEPGEESVGAEQEPGRRQPYALEVGGLVSEGQLQMGWRYQGERGEEVERVAQEFVRQLEAVIAHCQTPGVGGYTPSDFPLAHLAQDKLDAVASLIKQIDREELEEYE